MAGPSRPAAVLPSPTVPVRHPGGVAPAAEGVRGTRSPVATIWSTVVAGSTVITGAARTSGSARSTGTTEVTWAAGPTRTAAIAGTAEVAWAALSTWATRPTVVTRAAGPTWAAGARPPAQNGGWQLPPPPGAANATPELPAIRDSPIRRRK